MNHRTAAAAGVLVAVAAAAAGANPVLAFLYGVLTVAAMTDAAEHRIPNAVAVVASAAAAAVWLMAGAPIVAFLAAAISGAALYLLWQIELVGGGDVKLMPAIALAAASLGDPSTAALRVIILALILVGVTAAWSATMGEKEGPLAVGAPLALALAVAL